MSVSKDNRKKKICFIAPTVYPYYMGKGNGGAELQVIQLSHIFSQNGYCVSIITGDYGQPDFVTIDGVDILKVSLRFLGGSNFFFLLDSIRLIVKIIKMNPDICIVKSPVVILFYSAMASLFNHSIKTVKIFQSNADFSSHLTGHHPSSYLYRIGFKLTKLFVFQTEKQKEETFQRTKKKGVVIPNIFIPEYFVAPSSKGKKDIDVLWVGDFNSNKSPEVFYEIAKELSQYKFGMIAKHLPDSYASLHKRITSLNNVNYFGFVPFNETQLFFERSKIYLCSSKVEGFPNTFLQACWSRIPIVSLTFSCDNLLQREHIGYVSGTVEKMKEDIINLMEDNNKRKNYGNNGYNYLCKNHLPEIVYNKYRIFFDKSLSGQ